MITEQEVVSSQFKKVKYDSEQKSLIITFNNGKRYEYLDVSEKAFNDFMMAESLGKFFLKEIKGKYSFNQIL